MLENTIPPISRERENYELSFRKYEKREGKIGERFERKRMGRVKN
jgi:hypothetical protein